MEYFLFFFLKQFFFKKKPKIKHFETIFKIKIQIIFIFNIYFYTQTKFQRILILFFKKKMNK